MKKIAFRVTADGHTFKALVNAQTALGYCQRAIQMERPVLVVPVEYEPQSDGPSDRAAVYPGGDRDYKGD